MEPSVVSESVTSVGTALSAALQTTVTETLGVLSSLLPIAIGVMTAGVVISFGLKLFKRITGKA